MHQLRLRVHRELSKLEKKLAALSSVLAEGSSQHLQAGQESEDAELDTRSACAELCRTALKGLRRSFDFFYGASAPRNRVLF